VIEKNGISYKTLLVKNPAGMNLTLNVFKEISTHPVLMFILNDNLADGRDVSWIWDSDFEVLNQTRPKLILVSGERAEDMLLRIKYAVGPLTKISKGYYKYSHGEIIMNKDLNKIETELKSRIKEELIFVLPTYTAMLSFRKYLLGNAINEQ
jgi:UDP-N-acetylmuramyl tripeptide synthase